MRKLHRRQITRNVGIAAAANRVWRGNSAHSTSVLNGGSASGTLAAMDSVPPPLAFFCLLFSGWVNRQQQAVIEYLLEENRVLRAVHGRRRLRLTDDQRRRLAVKGKVLG